MNRLMIAGCVLLAGCTTSGYDREGHYYPQIPIGSTIELQHPLVIPNGWARSFVQFGAAVMPHDRDLWSLYCDFEVQRVQQAGEQKQEVRPGRFVVTDVDWLSEPGAAFYIAIAHGEHDNAPSNVSYSTQFRLHSEDQPEVRAMSCTHRIDHLFYPRQPTRDEMRAALNGVARIILPADSAATSGESAPTAE